jgi:protocatechuate 3,4-dioxygenase beta subunit
MKKKERVPSWLTRRQALETMGGVAAVAFTAACSKSSDSPTSPSSTTGGSTSACAVTPSETEGPYPDRLGMINSQAFFRRDITEGRPGLALSLVLTIVNTNQNCQPLSNAAVEIWQCDATGNYSEYSQPGYDGTGQTFLRGLQVTDANGQVTFTTIYPGWYAGRATHIHVDVFVNGVNKKITQVAFPEATTTSVYASGVYASKGRNPTSNSSDMVFSDGTSMELATLAGSVSAGYVDTLTIGVTA